MNLLEMDKVYIPLHQGSKEWEEWRKNKIGSSVCSAITGTNPYMNKDQIFDDAQENKAMRMGKLYEQTAREAAEKYFNQELTPICVESSHYPFLIASIDGYNAKSGLLVELKCPQKPVKKPHRYWIDQILFQGALIGAESMHCFVYDSKRRQYQSFYIPHNNKRTLRMIRQCLDFYYQNKQLFNRSIAKDQRKQ